MSKRQARLKECWSRNKRPRDSIDEEDATQDLSLVDDSLSLTSQRYM